MLKAMFQKKKKRVKSSTKINSPGVVISNNDKTTVPLAHLQYCDYCCIWPYSSYLVSESRAVNKSKTPEPVWVLPPLPA